MTPDTMRLELTEADANELGAALDQASIKHASFVSRQLTGETVLVGMVIPIAIGAVQVVATFLAARRSKPPEKRLELHVTVKGKFVSEENFSREEVETIIDYRLSE